jgi:phosphohistidine phosphatase
MQHSHHQIYPQSAIIPYRKNKGEIQILLITTRSGKKWTIPKGLIESHLTAAESARLEGHEEAGIEGELHPDSIGHYRYEKWNGICVVEVFPMRVTRLLDQWPESFMRIRRWVSLENIRQYIDSPILQKLIANLPDHLKG